MTIYGHPAPCIVALIDGGPAVMVEPLRFVAVDACSVCTRICATMTDCRYAHCPKKYPVPSGRN